MTCWTFEDGEQALPARRCELYEEVLHKILRDWPNAKAPVALTALQIELTLDMLGDVALEMMVLGIKQVDASRKNDCPTYDTREDLQKESCVAIQCV